MAQYIYKGYKISNLGYHQPDHCVWWEAVDKDGCGCFHGNTLREVEMMINDYEWECKIKAKDAEIASLRALANELADAIESDMKFKCAVCDTRRRVKDCHKISGFCSVYDMLALVTKARKTIGGAE